MISFKQFILLCFWSFSDQVILLIKKDLLRVFVEERCVLIWMMISFIKIQYWRASKELIVINWPLFCPFVFCLVDQECLKTSHCTFLLRIWSWILIFVCILGFVSLVIPFGVFWISHSEIHSDLLMIFGISISCILWLAILIYLICKLKYNWSSFLSSKAFIFNF